jgi:glycosyltransferase involved in cell wall biosynthesis
MPARPLVSLVVPFFNEGAGVELFQAGITPIMESIPDVQFEVLCVDDGSRDDTLARLVALMGRDQRFQVIELSRNFGKEAALTAGLDAVRGDAAIPMDADLQDPPELIPAMVEQWRAGYEVVLARRVDRSTDSFLKRTTATAFYRLHNMMSSTAIPENVGDYRLMDRRVIEALKRLPERQRFMKGLFAWVGFRTTTLNYTRKPRVEGESKFSGWRLWNLALEGLSSFSTAPLKIWSYIGLVGAVSSAAFGLFIIIRTLVWGADLPGYASLLVAVLFFGSLQLIGIGVLGEYIARIYMETKQRPSYLVREHHRNNDGS